MEIGAGDCEELESEGDILVMTFESYDGSDVAAG